MHPKLEDISHDIYQKTQQNKTRKRTLTEDYQNQVKLCTFKVQDDVQLAMAKLCLYIKDCRSQTSFNNSTINGQGQKILA